MALAELQKRKLQIAFEGYDFDGSGALDDKDIERVVSQTSKIRGLEPGSPDYEQLKSGFFQSWNELQKGADANKDGQVTLDEWYAFFDRIINNPTEFEQYIATAANTVTPWLDSDGDGKITLEDYKEFIISFNNSGKSEAEIAFKKLDTNGDGFLTHDELKTHMQDFYLATDENAPSNWFFGRL